MGRVLFGPAGNSLSFYEQGTSPQWKQHSGSQHRVMNFSVVDLTFLNTVLDKDIA